MKKVLNGNSKVYEFLNTRERDWQLNSISADLIDNNFDNYNLLKNLNWICRYRLIKSCDSRFIVGVVVMFAFPYSTGSIYDCNLQFLIEK